MNPTVDTQLSISDLEAVYDALALAIDQAGPDRSDLFLVKLALLNARALGGARAMREQMGRALRVL